MAGKATKPQISVRDRALGVLHHLTRSPAADPLLWTARAGLVIAAVAAVVVFASLALDQTSTPDESRQPRVHLDEDAPVPAVRFEALAGSESAVATYQHWAVPGDRRLLMIPAVGRDGRVWTGDMESETLTLHAASGVRPIALPLPAETGAHTSGVAVDNFNTIWLAQDGTHAIARYDPETRRYTAYPTPTRNSSPFGIAADASGRVWFIEVAARRIGVFDPNIETFAEYPLPDGAGNPYWLAVAPDGLVWFTTLTAPLVGVLDPQSGVIRMIPIPALSGHDGTTGIDLAADGAVWFGTREGMLGRIDPTSLSVATYRTPGERVYGVAADRNGRVWAASTRNAVFAFDPAAAQFCSVQTGDGAWWLTDAPDGSIWVSESIRGASGLGWISPDRAAAPCEGGAG
jgi:virginiamycin B lyase